MKCRIQRKKGVNIKACHCSSSHRPPQHCQTQFLAQSAIEPTQERMYKKKKEAEIMSKKKKEAEIMSKKKKEAEIMSKKKKEADRGGPSEEPTDNKDEEMDFKKIMKDIELFSSSHMTWKERKECENRKVVDLGGKPPKKQRLTLSVARPMMKKQKEREEKMLQERLILGQFGGKHGGTAKRSVGRRKPEDRGLKASEGHFRNGVLDVKHLLHPTPSRDSDSGTHVVTYKGKKKGGGKNGGKKKGGGRKRH